jgi:hypothetical protein
MPLVVSCALSIISAGVTGYREKITVGIARSVKLKQLVVGLSVNMAAGVAVNILRDKNFLGKITQ